MIPPAVLPPQAPTIIIVIKIVLDSVGHKLKLYVEYKNEIDILICREVIECIKKAIFESKNNKILRDKFINDAYDYLGKKCNKIIYNKGQKPYIYKNKLFLKIYIMIKGK